MEETAFIYVLKFLREKALDAEYLQVPCLPFEYCCCQVFMCKSMFLTPLSAPTQLSSLRIPTMVVSILVITVFLISSRNILLFRTCFFLQDMLLFIISLCAILFEMNHWQYSHLSPQPSRRVVIRPGNYT